MADLLALIHRTDAAYRQTFACPRLGIELECRLLPAHEVAAARMDASTQWGDREIRTAVDEQGLSLLVLRYQLGRAVFHDGTPVGQSVVDALDETTLRRWAAVYTELEARVDPPLDTWSDDDIERLIAGLKKKEPACVASLMIGDVSTLVGLLLITAGRLEKSETLTS